jgi:DegV family protein with EDD domain
MNTVKVLTDSNICLPANILHRYQIGIVPFRLIFGDEVFLDGEDITPKQFYRRLRDSTVTPTTSAPAPAHYQQAYATVKDSGASAVLMVTVSTKLSMAYESALKAAEALPGFPIEVFDSGLATTAQGYVTLSAAKAAQQGANLEQVLQTARETVPDCGFVVMLDTLTYLHRGGRVPAIASILGSALRIRPLLGDKPDGLVGIIAPARGTSSAIERIIKEVKRRTHGRTISHLAVMHADNQEAASTLLKLAQAKLRFKLILETEFSPVMGAHTGPGAVGLAYYAPRD